MKNDIEIILELLKDEVEDLSENEIDFDYDYNLGIKKAIEIVEHYKHKVDLINKVKTRPSSLYGQFEYKDTDNVKE